MSVKRYQPVPQFVEPSYQAQMVEAKVMEFSEGEYVLHSDYARLKAEVERLTRKLEVADNHAQCLEMVINAGTAKELRLKAEVERLNNLIISGGAVNPDASVYTE